MSAQHLFKKSEGRVDWLSLIDLLTLSLMEASPELIFLHNQEGRVFYLNASALKKTKYTKHKALKMKIFDFFTDQELFKKALFASAASKKAKSKSFFAKLKTNNGLLLPVKVILIKAIKKNGDVTFLALAQDLNKEFQETEKLQRINRALKVLSKCNQELIRASGEKELLQKICRLLIKEGGYRLAWVGYAENDKKKSVHPVAQFGFEKGYLKTLNITWADTNRGRGPTGTAIRTGKPAICRNILKDPKFSPWRQEAKRRGYSSSIALPLKVNDKAFGALNIYSPLTNAFDRKEVKLLTELSNNLAYGITTLRNQNKIEEMEKKYRAIFENTGSAIAVVEENDLISMVDKKFEELTGFLRSEVEGKRKWTEFVAPEDLPRMQRFRKLRRKNPLAAPASYEFRYFNSKKETRNALINVSLIPGTKVTIASFIDITTQKQTENELRRVSRALKALTECAQAVIHTANEKELLEKVCQVIVKTGGYKLAWVGYTQKARQKQVIPVAYNGYQSDYLKTAHIWWDNSKKGNGPTGTAIKTGKPYVERDILNQKTILPWQKAAKKRGFASVLALPLISREKVFGALTVYSGDPNSFNEEEINLLNSLAEDLSYGISYIRTIKQLNQTLEKLVNEKKRYENLAKKVIELQEKERRYLASEIHDELLQGLVATSYFLQTLEHHQLPDKTKKIINGLKEAVSSSIVKGRALLQEIEPIQKPQASFNSAIKKSIEIILGDSNVKVEFNLAKKLPQLDPSVETNILRIIQETFLNIRKHSKATKAWLTISYKQGKIKLKIQDNGLGFDQKKVQASTIGHYGLLLMKERAALANGILEIKSEPGKGSLIEGTFNL